MAGNYVETVEELTARCNKSLISKALLNMQRAIVNKTDITSAPEQRKLLEVNYQIESNYKFVFICVLAYVHLSQLFLKPYLLCSTFYFYLSHGNHY